MNTINDSKRQFTGKSLIMHVFTNNSSMQTLEYVFINELEYVFINNLFLKLISD